MTGFVNVIEHEQAAEACALAQLGRPIMTCKTMDEE